jgi:hypothetical protein
VSYSVTLLRSLYPDWSPPFGLAAAEIFEDEFSAFDRRYAARLTLDEYRILNRLLSDWQQETVNAFATDMIALAERLITPTDVFVVMSFQKRDT